MNRSRCQLIFPLIALVVVGAACGTSTPAIVVGAESTSEPPAIDELTATPDSPEFDTAALQSLEAARSLWTSSGIDTYEYTYTRACECSESEFGPNTIVVVGGEVAEVRGPDGEPVQATNYTIEQLFDLTEESIRRGEPSANEYQSELGYPIIVSLDVEAQAYDGGFNLGIIGLSQNTNVEADLAAARLRWESVAPASYSMTYRLVCFCPELRATVTVENGEVVSFEPQGEVIVDEVTVEDLFADIQAAFDQDVARVTATFDPEFGYPVEYFIDEDEMIADEEHGYTVETFTATS
jgi:hypothetical protein